MNEHDLKAIFSSNSDDHSTPQWLFDKLNAIHLFTLDPAATDTNHKCAKYFTEKEDGLKQSWHNEVVFLNPPYSRNYEWVEKAFEEAKKNQASVVCLLPSRTDTKWWAEFVMKANKITFIQGRLKFGNAKNSAPFPSCIVEINPWSLSSPLIDSVKNKP